MQKGNVKIYDFNCNGEYELKEEISNKKFIKAQNSNQIINEDNLSDEKLQEELYSNPFLFQINAFNINYIESVEDFYVTIDDKNIKLTNIVRDENLNKRTKIKIIKKQFKLWKGQTSETINKTFAISKQIIEQSKKYQFKKIKFLNKFLLILGIILPIILLSNVITIINCSGIIYKLIGILLIILSIIGLFLAYIHDNKSNTFINILHKHQRLHKRSYHQVKRKCKKGFKNFKSYYLTGYKNNIFLKKPLAIQKIVYGSELINKVNQSSDYIKKEYSNVISKKNKQGWSYHMTNILSYILPTISGSYLVIMLLIHLIKILFVKGE